LRLLVGDELAVGEDLEIAVAVRFEQFKKLWVHERLAANDAEEDVAHLLRFADELVERPGGHRLHLCRDVDPAALTAHIARIDDADIKERRKHLAALQAALVPLDAQGALDAHVPEQFPEQTLVRLEQDSAGHLEEHRAASIRRVFEVS